MKTMNNFARAHDRYLEPPDDDPVCEDGCGEPLARDITEAWHCINKFCPLKFSEGTIEREMAELIADLRDSIDTLKWRLKRK